MAAERAGRNDPCPCGSGRKYKHCCERKTQKMSPVTLAVIAAAAIAIVAAVVFALTGDRESAARQVWDPAHGHYHTVQ